MTPLDDASRDKLAQTISAWVGGRLPTPQAMGRIRRLVSPATGAQRQPLPQQRLG